jgi:hypothetical protein
MGPLKGCLAAGRPLRIEKRCLGFTHIFNNLDGKGDGRHPCLYGYKTERLRSAFYIFTWC